MDKTKIQEKIKTMRNLQCEIMTEVAANLNERHQFKLGATQGCVSTAQILEVIEGQAPDSHPIYAEILAELRRLKIPIKSKPQAIHDKN